MRGLAIMPLGNCLPKGCSPADCSAAVCSILKGVLAAPAPHPACIAQHTAHTRCFDLRTALQGACAVEDNPLCMDFRSPIHGHNLEDQDITADMTWHCCAEALRGPQAQPESGNLQTSKLTWLAPAVQECPRAPGAARPCNSEALTADVACPWCAGVFRSPKRGPHPLPSSVAAQMGTPNHVQPPQPQSNDGATPQGGGPCPASFFARSSLLQCLVQPRNIEPS